jgi:sulfur carrier protein ThiS
MYVGTETIGTSTGLNVGALVNFMSINKSPFAIHYNPDISLTWKYPQKLIQRTEMKEE